MTKIKWIKVGSERAKGSGKVLAEEQSRSMFFLTILRNVLIGRDRTIKMPKSVYKLLVNISSGKPLQEEELLKGTDYILKRKRFKVIVGHLVEGSGFKTIVKYNPILNRHTNTVYCTEDLLPYFRTPEQEEEAAQERIKAEREKYQKEEEENAKHTYKHYTKPPEPNENKPAGERSTNIEGMKK